MGIQFTIQNNTFNDDSAVMKNCTISDGNSADQYSEFIEELNDIKKQIETNTRLYEAIIKLEDALSEKDNSKISKVVSNYVSEFSQTFFSSIASTALMAFLSKL